MHKLCATYLLVLFDPSNRQHNVDSGPSFIPTASSETRLVVEPSDTKLEEDTSWKSSNSGQIQGAMAVPRFKLKVAAAHLAPVYMDKEATTKKVIDAIRDAGAQGVELLAFPETFIPGYPV